MIKNKIAPVLRFAGSKYKKLDIIMGFLDFQESDKFLDMFSGSGIIGVNVKHLTNVNVTINDFDNILPISQNIAIKNMLSYGGLGSNFTKSSLKYFNTRLKNGYWEKLKIYNQILESIYIKRMDYKDISLSLYNKIYVDPPYYKSGKGLYKNNEIDHLFLFRFLNAKKDDAHILISYNDCKFIRNLYKGWYIYESNYKYTSMGSKKSGSELFISNKKRGEKWKKK